MSETLLSNMNANRYLKLNAKYRRKITNVTNTRKKLLYVTVRFKNKIKIGYTVIN